MDKRDIIQQLRAAKAAHVVWRANALALLCGFNVDQATVPVIHTSTKFGQWYYGRGQVLSQMPQYTQLETHLVLVHQIYMQMYKLVFGEVKSGLFRSKEKIKQNNFNKAKDMMINLNAASESLVQTLTELEQELIHMAEDEILALY